jgi:hypothetical protein
MSYTKQQDFGLMDIPMSCSLFMGPALNRYKRYLAPLPGSVGEYVREWNRALVETMKEPDIKRHLGDTGHKILNGTIKNSAFLSRCTSTGNDISGHSLHYALRFSESAKFLGNKIQQNPNGNFVDLGAGLSPLASAIQTEYNISGAYIVDEPQIMDAYIRTANRVGGRIPQGITWHDVQDMATQHKMDTMVAMGVFHYMPLEEQIKYMRFINANIPNFLIEIKYDNNDSGIGENTFSLKQLQSLRLLVNNAQTLETAMIRNSLRYLSNFMHAMPNKKDYLVGNHSLFLSR